jgi:hypothetical protein
LCPSRELNPPIREAFHRIREDRAIVRWIGRDAGERQVAAIVALFVTQCDRLRPVAWGLISANAARRSCRIRAAADAIAPAPDLHDGVECRRRASPGAQPRFPAHCLRRLVAACRRSWDEAYRLHRLGGGKGQVRQSATTEFWFGSRLMVALRRRAGTRALGDAAAAHCPGHHNLIKRSVRRRRRKADRNKVRAALARPERASQRTPE